MYFVDHLHQRGIGVILDWVPAHFPTDAHGLGQFDGTHLYEHADPREGFHPEWDSCIFNYGRHEVRSFLISSAHCSGSSEYPRRRAAGGWRGIDAVPRLLAQGRASGFPTGTAGGRICDAMDFLRQLNAEVYARHPDVQTIAEESTAWPGVSRPTYHRRPRLRL